MYHSPKMELKKSSFELQPPSIIRSNCNDQEIICSSGKSPKADRLPSLGTVVDSVFELDKAIKTKPKAGPKRLTPHRLLTSDEIYHQKKEDKEQKEIKEKEKEQRKLERKRKQENKAKKIVKKQKKSKESASLDRHFNDALSSNTIMEL